MTTTASRGSTPTGKVIASVDVVLIANAAKFHPMHMKAAIEAGKHVFVEKPHAIDPAGIKVVRAACELAGRSGSVWCRGCTAAIIRAIGKPSSACTTAPSAISWRSKRTSCGRLMGCIPRQPGLTEVEYQGSNQYHFHWLSGDDVPQSLVHNLDRSSWALRGQTAAEVPWAGWPLDSARRDLRQRLRPPLGGV